MREIQEITINDRKYPEKLKRIKNPPFKLYAIGNVDLLNKQSLAIIGTRHITEYGIKNCQYFTQKLVEKDIPIVSGMAIGTDTIAHKTTLKYGGETIAVLGSGFEHIFPKENYTLFENIIESGGLVITEYEKNIYPQSERFLQRNRIVSGLSEGVLIIEAGYRSGTSVTASLAYSQGKIVMALPGRLDSKYGVGVNKLIQDGAKLITNVNDILINFPQFENKKWKKNQEIKQSTLFVDKKYQEIVEILSNKTLSVEEIVQQTKEKNLRKVLNLLIDMELDNIVTQEIGVGYKLL